MITVSNDTEKAVMRSGELFQGTPELTELLNAFIKANNTNVDFGSQVRYAFEPLGYTVEADEWELPDGWVQ